MTFHRTSPERGFRSASTLPKGPSGRALCRFCAKEVPKGRQTFCGAGCVHEWKIRTQPAYARKEVFKRDAGRCAVCDVVDLYWEADHIRPVSEGGGECGLEGFRTLCLLHHKQATRELAQRRAARPRPPDGVA